VASRLASALRESDTLGRLGGDEFLVLVDGASLDDGPEVVAQRLLDVLREPFRLEGGNGVPLSVSASIGIATGDRASAEDLLRDADVALYAAKAAGRNRYAAFQLEMQTMVRDRMELESDLRHALTSGQFFLVYQPIVNLADMAVTGVEALLRWRHPTRGIVLPDQLIPLLEESRVIVEVGRWVLFEACRQTAAWQAHGLHLDISVNVSARQLRAPGFLSDVTEALSANGIDPASLTIEVNEATIRSGPEATNRLKAVKVLGVRVAIDDFGTGWSSMAYLSHYAVDALKFDRSFIKGADTPAARAVVQAIVQLGRSIGLETLAEGIEEEHEVRALQDQHFARGQGYLFARPLEARELEEFLSRAEPLAGLSARTAALPGPRVG
jgi:EAL domain-containing protein (putative c-di-GMP-specific phosphodiesterase class I)